MELTTEQIKQLPVDEQIAYRLRRRGLRLADAGAGERGWYTRVSTWYEDSWGSEQYWVTELDEPLPERDLDGSAFQSPEPTEEEQAAYARFMQDSAELAEALNSERVAEALVELLKRPHYGYYKVNRYIDRTAIAFGRGVVVEVWVREDGQLDRVDTLDTKLGVRLSTPGSDVSALPREGEALELAWAYEDEAARDRSGDYPRNQ